MSHTLISPEALHQRLRGSSDGILVDVRTPAEFDAVHAVGALNQPLDRLDPKAFAAQHPKLESAPVFLICQTQARSVLAAERFVKAGLGPVYVVQGGTQRWLEAGLPVQRGTSRVISLERQVRIAAGSLVFLGVTLGYFVHPGFYGLAAFVGAGLVFAGITDFCGMGLLLAKLPWNSRRSA